jgi:Pyruvate phosphate dikinase, AMP/ATP-binding domain
MKNDALEAILGDRKRPSIAFDNLMQKRVHNILLVSSLYDSFTFVEDGKLTDMLFTEYLELNIKYAPRIDRVSTAKRALERLRKQSYDLVISMVRIGSMDIRKFASSVRVIQPGVPVLLLAFNRNELKMLRNWEDKSAIDKIFVWNGDARLFLSMVKYVEDRLNAWHDAKTADVQVIIVIEDSVRFYSAYLSILYTEIMSQTQMLMRESLNKTQRIIRQQARPKVLLATSYEEGIEFYDRYKDYMIGTILDAGFPVSGKHEMKAGLEFAKMVKSDRPDCAVLIQSSEQANAALAKDIGAAFIHKQSPTLLHDVSSFLQAELGFGDFIFRRRDGSEVTTASDLRSMRDALDLVPEESLIRHGRRKDFSTWLLARTEFELAKVIRSKKMEEFETIADFRKHLIQSLVHQQNRSRAGIVSEFSSDTFEGGSGFFRIGTGSLGGKGRGLAFLNTVLEDYNLDTQVPGVRFFVPPTAVLATDIFEQVVENLGLESLLQTEPTDEEVHAAFQKIRLPKDVTNKLRAFLNRVRYPLAVRSSSLLEDASYQPFAGIYKTYMIPNNQETLDDRVKELRKAIKAVYASTFLNNARAYLNQTPNRLEEEKMAVIIQQVIGQKHDNYVYPDVAGIARSHNFYPLARMKAKHGLFCPVLGFGRTAVEGGRCLRFSPVNPEQLFDVFTPRDYLNNAQRTFFAMNTAKPSPDWNNPNLEGTDLDELNLDEAIKHGTFESVGSVYSPQNRSIEDPSHGRGVKLVTMSGLLKDPRFPIADGLAYILDIGRAGLSCPVEIEFAANIKPKKQRPLEIGLLQIRPMVVESTEVNIDMEKLDRNETLALSSRSLGHGSFDGIRDIIYVRSNLVDSRINSDVAVEIGEVNSGFKKHSQSYVLIGPGRWGSADKRLGIPVSWAQISNVRCIVETEPKGIRVVPSQGSHFFQNISSFGVGYYTINSNDSVSLFDRDWLDALPAKYEGKYIRHITFDEPLDITIDSTTGVGIVMKSGFKAPRQVDRL